MSLILDALRKLEREKGAHEPGVLVVGSVPWGERSPMRRVLLAAGAVLALSLAVLAGWLMRRGDAPAAARPATVAATPAPAASDAPVPLPPTPAPIARAESEAEAPPAPPLRLARPPVVEQQPSARERAALAEEHEPEAGATTAPAPAATPAAAHELRLSAISQRDGKPVALINDRLVFEGDSFDGVRVLRIGEAEVEVEVKGQRQVLRF